MSIGNRYVILSLTGDQKSDNPADVARRAALFLQAEEFYLSGSDVSGEQTKIHLNHD